MKVPKVISSTDIVFAALKEDQMWGMIRRQALTDPVLKGMLDDIKLYWILKYDKTFDKK